MVQVIQGSLGSPLARLGAGLGKGLAEQLPKEVERSRLSSGLDKFQKTSLGKNPAQQAIDLYKIPGVTPEMIYTLAPLLRQQAAREEGANFQNGGNVSNTSSSTVQRDQASNGASGRPENKESVVNAEKRAGQNVGLKSLEATRAQLEPIQQKDENQLYAEATDLSQRMPINYPTPADALPFVRNNENTRVANLQEKKRIGDFADQLDDKLRKELKSRWGDEATLKQIPQEVQTALQAKLVSDLLDPKNKLSEKQLVEKWGKIGQSLAHQDTLLDERSKQGWLSGDYSPSKIKNTIANSAKSYADADASRYLRDSVTAKFNLSTAEASYLTYPRSKEAKKIVIDFKTQTNVGHLPKDVAREAANAKNASIKSADDFAGIVGDKDSPLAVAMDIKRKGGDPKAFIKRLNDDWHAGLWSPTADQQEELSVGIPFIPSLGDVYLFSLMGEGDLVLPND